MKKVLSAIMFFALQVPAASWASCSWTKLQNGSTADAIQVMNNFDCLAPSANPEFSGQVGINAPGYGPYALWVNGRAAASVSLELDGNAGEFIIAANTTFNSIPSVYALTSIGSIAPLAINPFGANVGIGTSSPSYTLHVNGSVAGVGAYNSLSDVRLKKDVEPIRDALAIVTRLRGIRFRWRAVGERSIGKNAKLPVGTPQIGFIAQELKEALPEAVSVTSDRDRTMSVAESKVVPVLVEAMKELVAENRKLGARVAALERRSAPKTTSP